MGVSWDALDFNQTVRDFDFTRRAIRRVNSVVYSPEFEEMDSDAIFKALFEEMQLVPFNSFLKRYIYERAMIDEPFSQVDDEVYRDILMGSFEENNAPHSFEPTSTKWSATVKGWLRQDSVKRSTVFLLGFGLRMQPEDVSEFLTKVLLEDDFRTADAEEVVYWYCYKNSLRYSRATKLLEKQAVCETDDITDVPVKTADNKVTSCEFLSERITDEESLLKYLAGLKKAGIGETRKNRIYEEFDELVLRAKASIAKMYQQDEAEEKGTRVWTAADITSSDLEKVISCGIPVNQKGNLQKMSDSVLSGHFQQKRLSRQRIDKIRNRELTADRFDLITLLFFVYSQEEIEEEPEVRCRKFIDEINGILNRCSMHDLYVVNPYESFVLMCLLSEVPLATYADIWDMSYSSKGA